MVEIRVTVEDDMGVHALMRRLAALFGRSAISFDHSRSEVRVESEWESRALVEVIETVEAWIAEVGCNGARLSIGEHSYYLEAEGDPRPLQVGR